MLAGGPPGFPGCRPLASDRGGVIGGVGVLKGSCDKSELGLEDAEGGEDEGVLVVGVGRTVWPATKGNGRTVMLSIP